MPTPNLDKVLKYAKDNRKTKLVAALKKMYAFVGADDLKDSFGQSIMYYIVTNRPNKVRRSKRRRRVVKKLAVSEETQSEDEEADEDENDDNFQNTLFKLMLAEKLQEMIGGDSDDSDDEDYEPGAKRKRNQPPSTAYKRLHTCLLGQPGTGKTTFAGLMVDVWDALGVVDKKKFFVTGRGDWVAKYHGHSSQKAKKLIKSAKGGCIFIDEAYSLIGSNDDMFGSEVLTSIVEAMTSKEVVFILAGYKDKMDRLFKNNAGLERRFSYIYEFPKPTVAQTVNIFKSQVKESKWKLGKSMDKEVLSFFQRHQREFCDAGGSTEKFVGYCQHAAVTRSFPNSPKRQLILQDFEKAIESMRAVNKKMSGLNDAPHMMYL